MNHFNGPNFTQHYQDQLFELEDEAKENNQFKENLSENCCQIEENSTKTDNQLLSAKSQKEEDEENCFDKIVTDIAYFPVFSATDKIILKAFCDLNLFEEASKAKHKIDYSRIMHEFASVQDIIPHKNFCDNVTESSIKNTSSKDKMTKRLLGKKTYRSEDSELTDAIAYKTPIRNSSKNSKNILKPIKEKNSGSSYKKGRWSDAEHQLFIHALIEHGKNWHNVKKHINSRGYFQIVQYATRFLNRIRKVLNISSYLSYDSMNLFKKLNTQRKVKRVTNQNPRYDLDFRNYKNEKEKINNLQNFFFEFIMRINHSNFNRFCIVYRALINSEIISFLIKQFLVVNIDQNAHFKILKSKTKDEKMNFRKSRAEKNFGNYNYFDAHQDLERINNLTINLINTALNENINVNCSNIFYEKDTEMLYDFNESVHENSGNHNCQTKITKIKDLFIIVKTIKNFFYNKPNSKLKNTLENNNLIENNFNFNNNFPFQLSNPECVKINSSEKEKNNINTIHEKHFLPIEPENNEVSSKNSENYNLFVSQKSGKSNSIEKLECQIYDDCNPSSYLDFNSFFSFDSNYSEIGNPDKVENTTTDILKNNNPEISKKILFQKKFNEQKNNKNTNANYSLEINIDRSSLKFQTNIILNKEKYKKPSKSDFSFNSYTDGINKLFFEKLKFYFKEISEDFGKTFKLDIDSKEEFAILNKEKLNKFIITTAKSADPTLYFDGKTNKLEKLNHKNQSNNKEINIQKDCKKLESPFITKEEMKIIDSNFSDVQKKHNSISHFNQLGFIELSLEKSKLFN